MQPVLSARELEENDIPLIADYWTTASKEYLLAMGAEIEKLPPRDYWFTALAQQLADDYNQKKAYATIWQIEGQPIGHCNLFPIYYGNEAGMHLHIWKPEHRKLGYGAQLVKLSLPLFFRNMRLKTIICEPYALNDGPNKTLEKAGFEFIKEYTTTPHSLAFEQPVKRWQITAEQFVGARG